MSKFYVEFYKTDDGGKPVRDFLLSQDVKMKAKLLGLINLLEEYGTQLREPYSAPIDDGIFELRCKQGSNISRVLYFFYYDKRIVLTNGFIKKSQKTPTYEIEKAKLFRKRFIERMKCHE